MEGRYRVYERGLLKSYAGEMERYPPVAVCDSMKDAEVELDYIYDSGLYGFIVCPDGYIVDFFNSYPREGKDI